MRSPVLATLVTVLFWTAASATGARGPARKKTAAGELEHFEAFECEFMPSPVTVLALLFAQPYIFPISQRCLAPSRADTLPCFVSLSCQIAATFFSLSSPLYLSSLCGAYAFLTLASPTRSPAPLAVCIALCQKKRKTFIGAGGLLSVDWSPARCLSADMQGSQWGCMTAHCPMLPNDDLEGERQRKELETCRTHGSWVEVNLACTEELRYRDAAYVGRERDTEGERERERERE